MSAMYEQLDRIPIPKLLDALRRALQVKDIDFKRRQFSVHSGKGFNDRIPLLREAVIPEPQRHMKRTRAQIPPDGVTVVKTFAPSKNKS